VTALETYCDLVLGTADAKAMLALSPDAETPAQYSAAYNAAQLAQFGERDVLRLADLLVPSVSGLPVDCWISADPATFLLLGYGRVSRRSQIVRGRIAAGGNKPWLAVAFDRLLAGP